MNSNSLLATYFSYAKFEIDFDTVPVPQHHDLHRIPQRHRNVLFMKLLGTRLLHFTFFVVIDVENSVT